MEEETKRRPICGPMPPLKVQSTNLTNNNNTNLSIKNVSSSPSNNVRRSTKRTFANIVWPLDPEEEKILRSNSPFIVPEVIVQRNESVKSILKKSPNTLPNLITTTTERSSTYFDLINNNNKNNEFNYNSIELNGDIIGCSILQSNKEIVPSLSNLQIQQTQQQTLSTCSSNNNKKKVEFLENFCFINFFDISTDDMLSLKNHNLNDHENDHQNVT